MKSKMILIKWQKKFIRSKEKNKEVLLVRDNNIEKNEESSR